MDFSALILQEPMKMKLLALVFSTLIVASSQFSLANCGPTCYSSDPCCPCNWYIAASGSVAWHNHQTFDVTPNLSFKRNYKVGGGAAVSVGYIFDICNCWNLRIEVEGVWRRNSIKDLTVSGFGTSFTTPASGHTQDTAIMANLIADFPFACCWNFYIGGGLGVSFNKLTISIPNTTGTSVSTTTSNNSLFAWQGLGGLSYDICQNIALTAGYRIFGTEKRTTGGIKSNNIPLIQSVDLGLRFRI